MYFKLDPKYSTLISLVVRFFQVFPATSSLGSVPKEVLLLEALQIDRNAANTMHVRKDISILVSNISVGKYVV